MRIDILTTPIEQVETEALVVFGFEKEPPTDLPVFGHANQFCNGWLEDAYRSGEFKGKPGDTLVLHRPAGLKARRLVLSGLGQRARYSPAALRQSAASVVRVLRARSISSAAFALDSAFAGGEYTQAITEGALIGDFEPDRYKTDAAEKRSVDVVTILPVPGTAEPTLAEFVRRGQVIAESQNFARELANEPANRMTPAVLAERARQMAAESGLECEVLDQDRMRHLGMGALLGVAQGSSEPPALIIVRYRPKSAGSSGDHLGLVGKGVTFDTGGISIKPSEGMEKMKYDMSGGAAVLAAMRALARLEPAIPVTALVPAVENMPGSRAQRPGDIVTTLNGKTVEVLNTDAEGRLILIDALEYARRLGCTHLVDAATLTGAIVVALGHVNVGVFASDDALVHKLLRSADGAGEKMWQMPLDEDYKEALKSAFADLPNIGNRWGGAITAAMFLKEFVGDTPWVHLDIAGTAWLDEPKPFMAKGPTGVAVRTFVHLAMNW
jgi:leucyl aminopeptidase